MTEEVQKIYELLKAEYPDVRCELDYDTPLQLVTATVLSAQTTDRQVNKVTRKLFAEHPDLDSLLELSVEELEEYIRSLGFYHMKARNLYQLFRQVAERFGGEVPSTMEELTSLPGVGRKTANVVMSNAFGIPAIAVDTHVFRVSNRIGLANAKNVEETERQLQKALDPSVWSLMHHLLIFHGRRCCSARSPECERCVLGECCKTHREEGESHGETD